MCFDRFEPFEDVTVEYPGGFYGRFRAVDPCDATVATVEGTDGNNLIFGASGADVIVTGDGTNVVFARSGDDIVTGGAGNDLVFAGNDDDTVDGGDGYDHVNGGPGDDSCVNAESVTSC